MIAFAQHPAGLCGGVKYQLQSQSVGNPGTAEFHEPLCLPHDFEAPLERPHQVKLVEAFLHGRPLQPLERAEQTDRWYKLLFVALRVALLGSGRVRLEEVADHPEARLSCRGDIARSFFTGRIGIVDDEALLRGQAGVEETRFPVPRLEEIEADAHMRIEKALPVERGLAAGLDSDEEKHFHDRIAIPALHHRLAEQALELLSDKVIAFAGRML